MEDWEDEEIAPISLNNQPKGLWDDEDADEDDVKDSWEDEDEPEPEPIQKAPKKPEAKATENNGETSEAVKKVALDPVAEKLQQQRIEEESDFRATTELFSKKPDEKSLDNFIPKSELDFMEYAELVSHKLRPYEKSYHYNGLLKAVMRMSMEGLKGTDAREVSSSVTAIANEKIKLENNAGKKKWGAKKKQLQFENKKPEDDMDAGGKYDDLDDYDFM